ncbi:MAG: hypothetical protein R3C05_08645 [Pirellulaceae bacterium]
MVSSISQSDASLENIRLTIEGTYTPAELSDADETNDFSILNISADLDSVGLQLGLGDLLRLHGFGGRVSISISEDRSDDVLEPNFAFSLDEVRCRLGTV